MADSTSNLDTISSSQSQKEVTANALFDAGSPPTTYGRRASTTEALTWGYYGGKFNGQTIANGTVALTASSTNYIYADSETGAVTASTTASLAGKKLLYTVVTDASSVTSYTDHREAMFTPAVVGLSIPGKPTASAIYPLVFPFAVAFPVNFANSRAKATVAATAQTDFDIQKNGASIGTLRFAAAGTTGSFIVASAQRFAAGDYLSIVAPASQDATLANIAVSMLGVR